MRLDPSIFVASLLSLSAGFAHAQASPGTPASAAPNPAPTTPDERKAQARALFESGIAHFDRGEWSAALADFMRSRELFPTRSATKNAAVCLRKEGRFDESLDLLEDLLRSFPDLPGADRAFAEKEIIELRGAVGSIDLTTSEPGAAIVIDGRARGTFPPLAPLRVPAGSHVIRVYKDGFVPFERRVDVAGRQSLPVDASLARLTSGGRLAVTESSGKVVDVLVDNVVVGKTPWDGALAVGQHTVALRGDGDEGSPPASTSVKLDEQTRINLAAETLDASMRVAPRPANAMVSIDGVVVGQGVWEGKLRSGSHKVEVAAEGFLPQSREVKLADHERLATDVALERDPNSSLWRAQRVPRVFIEAEGGPAVGLTFGGDVRDACTGSCSAAVPFGMGVTVHAGYELASGIAFALDAGYLMLSAGTTSRPAQLFPKGLGPDSGSVDDVLAIRGARFGPSVAYRTGDRFPLTFRVGAGLFLGSASDGRTGTFTTSSGTTFPVSVSESSSAVYAYLAPEARIRVKVWSRLEASFGMTFLLLGALNQPTWTDRQAVHAGPAGQQGDGVAVFGEQSLAGGFLFTMVPSLGLHYAF